MMPNNTRTKIAEILVKNNLRTDQVAIGELVQLVSTEQANDTNAATKNNTVSDLEIVNITVGDGYVVPALANGNEAVQTNEELQKILNNLTQQVREEEQSKFIKIINWATGRDTGSSSEAICRFMLGLEPHGYYSYPLDSDDRGRCIRLLNLIPEWWDRLDDMASIPTQKTGFISFNLKPENAGWAQQIPLIKQEALRKEKEGV